MTYTEFRKRLEEWGLRGRIGISSVLITDSSNTPLIAVGKYRPFDIDCSYREFDKLIPPLNEVIFDIAVELAKTPVREREDEELYRLTMRGLKEDHNFLNYNENSKEYGFNSERESNCYRTKFSQEEIDKMPYNIYQAISSGVIRKERV